MIKLPLAFCAFLTDKCLQMVQLLIIRGDFGDLCNEQFPEINGPTPEMVAAAEGVKKKMLTVKTWPDAFQGWFKGMLGKGDDVSTHSAIDCDC